MAKQKTQNSLNAVAQLNPKILYWSLNGASRLKPQGNSSNQQPSQSSQSQGTQNQSGTSSPKK
jgi:hypothetical protein